MRFPYIKLLSCLVSSAVMLFPITGLTQTLPNVNYSAAQEGDLLKHAAPEMGRLAIIETLGDYVITVPEVPSSPAGSDFIIRAWDISNPSNPVEVARFGRTTHPFNAHGLIKRENEILINPYIRNSDSPNRAPSNNAIRLNADGSLVMAPWSGIDGNPEKGGMMRPWSARVWWSYGVVEGLASLQLDGQQTAQWDHLGTTGVIGMPIFMGNIMLYASDQSLTGVAAYDISDPSNPRLLDVLKMPDTHPTLLYDVWDSTQRKIVKKAPVYGLGGYWAEVSGNYLVFARRGENPGIQVVDFSDPSNLKLQCDFFVKDPKHAANGTPMPQHSDPMYVNFQDKFVFAGMHKVNIETCEQDIFLDEFGQNSDGSQHYVDTSQYARPIGNLVVTGGANAKWWWPTGKNGAGMGIWIHDSQRDTNPPYVSYHIPKPNQTNYPVMAPLSFTIPETLRSKTIVAGQTIRLMKINNGGGEVAIDYVLSHTGMLTVNPLQDLEANTTYEMQFLSGIKDAANNTMQPYSFRFSTGATVAGGNNPPPPPPPPVNQPPVIVDVDRPSGSIVLGDTATLTVNASDADGDTLEYRSRLGNAPYGNWTANNQFNIAFNNLGSNAVTIQVRDSSGDTATQAETFSVVTNTSLVAQDLTSSQIAYDDTNGVIWTVNPDNDTITKINAATQQVVGEYAVGEDPRAIAIDNSGNIWVTLHSGDVIEVLDSNGQNIGFVDTGYGSSPFGIVMHPSKNEAYVSLYGSGEVVRINTQTRQENGRIPLAPTARALALSNDGNTLLVTRFISGENWGEVWQVNTNQWTLSRTIPLHKHLQNDSLENGRGIPNYVSSVIINKNSTRAYVVGKKDNVDRGLLNNGEDLDDDNTVRTFASVIDLSSGNELTAQQFDFDNADSPAALTFSPTGNHLFVAMQGRNEVFALRVNDDGLTLDAQFAVGLAPQAVYMDANSNKLYAKNFMGRSLSAIDVTGFISSGSINPAIVSIDTVSNEKLTPSVLTGKQLFYNAVVGVQNGSQFNGKMSAEGYLSCATCHSDGGQDGRTYDFTGRGEGLRNNISLKGRSGTRFGNVHWTGNFDETHDFENDIRLRFLGSGFLTDDDFNATRDPLGAPKAGLSQELDNLAAYVDSLGKESLPKSPYRNNNGTLTTAASRGAALFEQQGCVDCHRGKAFTDGIRHDVGTYREYSGQRLGAAFEGVKTPSLLGLFETAPYLHDGSAVDIADVFLAAGGTVYQAEDANHNGVLVPADPSYSYFRHGAAVRLSNSEKITINHSMPSAGKGLVSFRYASTGGGASIKVSGTSAENSPLLLTSLPQQNGLDIHFREMKVELDMSAGNDSISLEVAGGPNATVVIDDITITDPAQFTTADSHTRASKLNVAEQNDLVSFLQQIDSNSAPEDDEAIVLGPIENSDDDNTGDGDTGSTEPEPETETETEDVIEPEPENDEVDSSGGGAMGLLIFLALGMGLIRRRLLRR